MNLDNLIDIFDRVDSVKLVIADGKFYDIMTKNRTFFSTPYVELVETNINLAEHTSTDRMRQVQVEGRLTIKKELDDIKQIIADLESEFIKHESDQVHLTIAEPQEFNFKCWQIPLQISYFETVRKI